MTDDTTWLDATAQADLVRRGDITPSELVAAAVERIEKLNPELNAVIHRQFDQAVKAARSQAVGKGPFPGVPLLLKDILAHEAGQPYHCGMRVLKDANWVEPSDSWLVERFRAAGFITLGRTNTPEMASTVTTESFAYGPTSNPWDPTRSAGGSSGGSAAAVASGMVAVAHGNDMGGSIRVPAANCGLVGLKPTRARTTLGPDFGEYFGPTTHQHVLTRSVRDSAAVLDAIAGPGVGDPFTALPSARAWAAECGVEPGRLRIGYRTALPDGAQPDPEVVTAVEATARLLEALGHDVSAVELQPLDEPTLGEAIPIAFSAWIARDLERWGQRLGRPIAPDELEPMNGFLAEMGGAITSVQYQAALEALQAWSRRMAAVWAGGVDIVVLPVTPTPPVLLGEMAPDAKDPFGLITDLVRMVTFTMPFNVTGQPAVSLPVHATASGLPVGVQLVGASHREDVLIRVASQLEQARPWAHRHPPQA